ncbi:probable LRR receptor-like serine/threonine-protein kinase At1g56130 [Aristolochia californica]|uniref:probable LRR receptor-like serine/threonine-protein kinase At1g56130 n=1 Tax=Aristolochia californica TaxID=171875 RepID=UPI0035E21C8E
MEFEFSLLLSLSVSALFFAAAQRTTHPAELVAIRAFQDYWDLETWNRTIDPCTENAPWSLETANPRLACDCSSYPNNTCHVTHLKIYALDIKGGLPKELFDLTELKDLNLGQNVLSGSIPPEIGRLSKMQYLSLGINNLSGLVPPELGNLTQLISLSFSSNKFSGALPKELGKLVSLEQLYIDSSGVSGEIPQELANLKSLAIIWASDNLFIGKLPEFLGILTDLRDLRIQGTLLEGPIPNTFSGLTKLEDLRLGDLTAADSSLFFLENLTSLSTLSLRNSRVAGEIPAKLGEFPNLKYLDLSFNKLSGQIPESFQNFKYLEFLYLGSNNLMGQLPVKLITPTLVALDVSFNPLSAELPLNNARPGLALNVVGTSLNTNGLYDRSAGVFHCFREDDSCKKDGTYLSFSVNCGGTDQTSASGVDFYDDSEILGPASLYVSSDHQWGVSNTGVFISNPGGPRYTAITESQITGTLESELYKTARISPSSLRYYGFGLKNGEYNVELHFAEIVMDDDSGSWKGLGRRLFDVYIQEERVLQDFNIVEEAKGWKRAVIRTFRTNVTNSIMDIHFFWAGKGTCCIPSQSTYGPLVSAIHIFEDSQRSGSSTKGDRKRIGAVVGIAIGSAAGLLIVSSIFYLWWTKDSTGRIRVDTDSPRKQ